MGLTKKAKQLSRLSRKIEKTEKKIADCSFNLPVLNASPLHEFPIADYYHRKYERNTKNLGRYKKKMVSLVESSLD